MNEFAPVSFLRLHRPRAIPSRGRRGFCMARETGPSKTHAYNPSMPEMIQINFNKRFPLFPLAGICLLPHATIPLHIFEPRYIRMVADSLDGSSQIAMATFEGKRWQQEYHGNPPVRPIVCLGQIERYERLPMDRYNIMLQGICRARIVEELMPDSDRPYRIARLAPTDSSPESHEEELTGWRHRVRELLESDPLSRMRLGGDVLKWFDREDIPSHVLIEIVGHLLMTTTEDAERRYRLLAEPDAIERADYTEEQLRGLERLVSRVQAQTGDWPKGCSWN